MGDEIFLFRLALIFWAQKKKNNNTGAKNKEGRHMSGTYGSTTETETKVEEELGGVDSRSINFPLNDFESKEVALFWHVCVA